MQKLAEVEVKIDPDADERARELWSRYEMDRMIEKVQSCVPDLSLIEVNLLDAEEQGPNAAICITAWTNGETTEAVEAGERAWRDWAFTTYPPILMRWFYFVTFPLSSNHAQ